MIKSTGCIDTADIKNKKQKELLLYVFVNDVLFNV